MYCCTSILIAVRTSRRTASSYDRTTNPHTSVFGQIAVHYGHNQWLDPVCLPLWICTILLMIARSPVERPVQVPLGNLFKFATSLLISSSDEEVRNTAEYIDIILNFVSGSRIFWTHLEVYGNGSSSRTLASWMSTNYINFNPVSYILGSSGRMHYC